MGAGCNHTLKSPSKKGLECAKLNTKLSAGGTPGCTYTTRRYVHYFFFFALFRIFSCFFFICCIFYYYGASPHCYLSKMKEIQKHEKFTPHISLLCIFRVRYTVPRKNPTNPYITGSTGSYIEKKYYKGGMPLSHLDKLDG